MLTNSRVPEEIRRANSRAIEARATWRRRYALVTRAIRDKRHEARRSHKHLALIELESLRIMAYCMMRERELIGLDLQATAYQYI